MVSVAVYDSKPYDVEFLQNAPGAEGVTWHFYDFRLNKETARMAFGADVVCAFVNDNLDRACLEVLAKVGIKHIALRCAGFNNIDLEAAEELELPVTRVPAYSPHAIAEHTLGLLLALTRKIHRAYNRVRDFNFSLNGLVGYDIYGKKVGVVGTGKIGKLVAELFIGMGAKVFVFDKFTDDAWAKEQGVEYIPFEKMLESCQILSFHVPLLPDTHHMLNSDAVSKMLPGTIVVNTSRGGVFDTKALIEGLRNGQIGGVAMDVYEEEEGVFFEDLSEQIILDEELARLMTFPNVLITAHQAFLSRDALSEIANITVKNILQGAGAKPFIEGTQVKNKS